MKILHGSTITIIIISKLELAKVLSRRILSVVYVASKAVYCQPHYTSL